MRPDDPITSAEVLFGHVSDPKTEILITHVRVEHPDIILIDRTPPTDAEQEELPY